MSSTQTNGKQIVRFYWDRVKKYPFTLLGVCILLPITVLVNQLLPNLVIANIIQKLSRGEFIPGQLWESFGNEIIWFAALVMTGGLIVWRLIDLLVWRLEGRVPKDIAQIVFEHLSYQSADFHANHFSGSLVSQTNKIIGSYIRMADTTFFSTIPLISSLIFTAIILWPRSPIFVICLILLSLFFVGTSIIVSRPVRQAGAVHAKAESKQTGYLADMIGNMMAVKSFAGEKFEHKAFGKITDNTHQKLHRLMIVHMKQMAYFSTIARVISISALVIAIISVVNFGANIATVFLILSYTTNIVDQLFSFSNSSLRNYNRSIGDATDMIEILNSPTEVTDPVAPEKKRISRGDIQFNNVSFTHKDAKGAIFKNLNLRIKPGEKVGLVGHSGSGKTSLTRILLRFSDLNKGSITIDGQDISAITQADLRSSISYVPQEPILFHRTIAENIAYGRPSAEIREITAISKQANADDFVQLLPKKYDTVVGERGVKLSGGQRQRIAIARAMLKNAPILVLDEATSALDSESEALIQDALWKLMEGRTAIVIAHRLSTIQKMDRILVLENGKIIEQGTHKELIHNNGTYADLWNRQSGGFLEE